MNDSLSSHRPTDRESERLVTETRAQCVSHTTDSSGLMYNFVWHRVLVVFPCLTSGFEVPHAEFFGLHPDLTICSRSLLPSSPKPLHSTSRPFPRDSCGLLHPCKQRLASRRRRSIRPAARFANVCAAVHRNKHALPECSAH